jgi:sugar lactone lactonase YvrE
MVADGTTPKDPHRGGVDRNRRVPREADMFGTGSRRRAAVIAPLAAALVLTGLPASAGGHVEEVASGFVGPLGLAIGQDGTVYVAEAFVGQLTTFKLGAPDDRTALATEPGFLAGVDAQGKGKVFHTSATEEGALLKRVQPNGKQTVVADLGQYEAMNNPDQDQVYGFLPGSITEECRAELPDFLREPYSGIVDSNPYAVAIDGGSTLVADAAGNTIVRVGANGRISTVAVLPPVDQTITQEIIDELAGNEEFPVELPDCVLGTTYTGEFVPTDVEIGPDGYLYVSSLPGIPEGAGEASVWRVDPSSGAATLVADGFSGAVDLAVAKDGTIYVAELFGNRISMIAGGNVSTVAELPMPGAIEVAPDGTVYATIGVFFPDGGSLVRITP